MTLDETRSKIDEIDRKLILLIKKRMEYSSEVARIKKAEGLPIYHAEREQQILDRVKQIAGEGYSDYIIDIYRNIMAISRVLQNDELTTSQSEQLSANPITTPNEIVSHPLGDG